MYTIHTNQIAEIVINAAMNGTLAAYPMTIGTMTIKIVNMAAEFVTIEAYGNYSGVRSTVNLYYSDSEFATKHGVSGLIGFILENEQK